MKHSLYGTTALVAAGALMASPASAEERIKLGVGGYQNNYFGAGSTDNDTSDYEATNIFNDGEIWFRGETTLDNGISFGANIQLEANSANDQIDENYAYVEGSFGRVLIGSENTAAYLMHYAAPGVGVPVNSGWVSTFVPAPSGFTSIGSFSLPGGGFRMPILSTNVDLGVIANDENVLTYFTPRFSGFQLGVTYTPAFRGGGTGTNLPALSDTDYQHGVSIGVNYVQTFNNVDIAVSGGYRRAEAPDNDVTGTVTVGTVTTKFALSDDPEQWSAGINVGFAGFTVGGSWAYENDDIYEGTSYDLGATYATGPWTLGLTWFYSETDQIADVDTDIKLNAVSGGVSYAVGPGIEAAASVLWADYDTDIDDADGVVAIVGLTFNF
jgi:hypothetical protein